MPHNLRELDDQIRNSENLVALFLGLPTTHFLISYSAFSLGHFLVVYSTSFSLYTAVHYILLLCGNEQQLFRYRLQVLPRTQIMLGPQDCTIRSSDK